MSGLAPEPVISTPPLERSGRPVPEAWNRTDAPFPADRCIHQLVEEQAARTPGAVAVVSEGASLTYRELNERANRLAHRLVSLGVGPEARVGVCLERGVELVAALLAVLKAGGAYVPLDPAYPVERLELMLADAGAAVLVTQEALRGLLPVPDGARVVSLDGEAAEIGAERAENPAAAVTPRSLAYLIYTSGSTGVPKGVAIEHQSAVVMLAWAWSIYSDEELGGMLASTSVSFDMSVFELFAPLARGGRVIVVENALALPRSAAADQVRLVDTVPSAIAALLESGGIPAGVKTVNLGGELLKPELVDALYAHGIERVYDLYGPSEDTTFSTFALRRPGAPPTIGRPLSNTRAHVVDGALRPVAVGEEGELYLGGMGVTRGYLGRPGLTAGRYLPDPFAAEPGARMYRTGDRVRWRPDGTLEYLGRLDHQVKIRGYRVEPGEIEAVLRRHPGVHDVVVVPYQPASGDRRLAAYLVPRSAGPDAAGGREGAAELVRDLRRAARERLPEYMVPAVFVPLERLPLSPNGKVDRRALPAPPERPDEVDAEIVLPRTETEARVAAIWAEVLGTGAVGVEDDVFTLGAHSLAVTLVASRLRARMGVELPMRELFASRTVAALAGAVERRLADAAAPPAAAVIAPAPRDGRLPLSTSQERVWFLIQLAPDNLSYNFQGAIIFRGALDAGALRAAISEVIRRHEAFRTTFPGEGGRPYQRVHAPFEPEIPTLDLSDLPAETRAAEEAALLRRSFSERFDITRLPLVRWILVRRAADEHVLVHIEHHIIHDGWSFNVFLRELLALYGAFAGGRPSPLPELPLQFGDFAHYQRRWLEGDEARRQLDFWRETLAGSSTVLELPLDRPRPAEQRFVGAAPRYELPADLYQRLRAASRAGGVTLFATMMAAFDVLLSRWSGQTDLNVGTGIANRRLDETQGLMGMFVNSMVVRARLDDDPPFAVLARRVHEGIVAAADHQEIPFEKLVEELQPERSLSRNPLFQAMFSFHDSPIPDLRLPGLEVEVVPGLSNGSAKFDMNVIAVPRAEQRIGQGRAEDADGITLVWEYSSDLWDAGTIDAMVAQYRALLEAAAAEPETPVSRLPMVAPGEREALLAAGRAACAFPVAERLHERFEARAMERPDAPAVTFEGATLSYGELNARANRLARRLTALGVGPETRVGVCLERSAELVVAILAVLKAGGGYVPLDPAYPAERIAFVLGDAGAPVLVTTSDLVDRLPDFGGTALCIDGDADAIAAESAENPSIDAGPDSLAYVIYTSGSTGTPKGVQVTHANVVRLFDATDEWFGFGADDAWTLFHSAAFDFSVWEIWGALLYGGRLVVVPYLTTRSPEDFHRLLLDEGVTVLSQTPSAFRQLVQADLASGVEPGALSLRHVVFGGEALEPRALGPWMDRHGDQPRLVNMYGITETTVHVTFREITRADLERGGSPIGIPIPDLSLYLLDGHGEPVPAAVPGELYVGGAGVARGYLNRPELTAERFVRDPFSADPAARLYRSGDLARRRADGGLEYLGRADSQVKLRGFRIEPGEIERVLLEQPSVAAAVVVVHGAGDDAALVAYVVPADGGVHAPELRAALKRRLPEHMVPGAIVPIDAIPLTANGKLDRRALPAPDEAGAAAGGAYAAPATPVEEVLAGIWAEVLRLDRVGTADRFFELGGHSLLATRVVSRVRAVFAVELPLRALFERPTVAELAEAVEALRRAGAPMLPPVLPADRDRPLPLSFAQERLWFLDRLEPGSALYNLRVPLRLEGALDVPALERSLGEIVRRHEALRTTFAEVEGVPVQVVAPFAGFPLPVEEVTGADAAAREAEALRRASAEGARPFDLERGPLFRALLLRLAPDDHLLLLWMHHAVSDGWSTGVLLRELSALYAAYREGGESPLSGLAVQYADYAAWQREQLRGDVLEREVAFWRARLAGAPALLELPTDRPRPAVESHRGSREPVAVGDELRHGLEALARREDATLYMVLLGAFQLLLSKYAGTDDVVVGTPIAGRTRAEAEPLIGLFVNTLVMRTGLPGDPTFRELLGRVRETTLSAYEHQDVPFERLVEALQPERSLSHGALFQVLFQLQQQALDGPAGALPGVRMERATLEIPHAKFDLTLDLASGPDGLRGTMEYATDLFDRATVTRMLGHFARVLEQVVADPGLRLSEVALMGADERRRVVEEWNPAGAPLPDEGGIARIFETRVAATPGAVAVMCGDESLPYGALNERANRLARVLRRRGVGAESRVGIFLERGVEMVVSILAVLKAGGAYVPLDPGYPAGRLAFMLADSAVAALLTEEKLRAALPAAPGIPVVSVDGEREEIARESAENVEGGAGPRSLAYVVYTSGSTGTPKGVAVEHRSVARLVRGADYADLGPDEVILQAAPVSFDASTLEIWGALLNGGRMAVVPGATPSLEELGRAIARHGVTTMWLTAGLFQVMVEERLEDLSGVRQLLAGGDVLPVEQVRKARDRFPALRLINGYGPTENTTFTCCHTVDQAWSGGPVPIGSPISGTRVYVLDEALRPVPAGVPGELCAGGQGVARGYLGRPAATAERFVPDPFSADPGARMYRTGDRVRWREVRECVSAEVRECEGADGRERTLASGEPERTHALTHSRTAVLEYLGRLDAQVKIRGFRIEPGEVEAVLRRESGVRECAVVVREDAPGEKRLVAYVVGEAEGDALRDALRGSLPEWMVPAAFVALDALPLTPNGKVDRKALPAPDSAPGQEYVAPRTPVETEMAAIWAEVLGRERVGATDDFFVALGGHSLAATRVVSRVRAALGVELPVRALFESPTVEALARAVEAARAGGTSPARAGKIPRAARVALAGAVPPASSDAG